MFEILSFKEVELDVLCGMETTNLDLITKIEFAADYYELMYHKQKLEYLFLTKVDELELQKKFHELGSGKPLIESNLQIKTYITHSGTRLAVLRTDLKRSYCMAGYKYLPQEIKDGLRPFNALDLITCHPLDALIVYL